MGTQLRRDDSSELAPNRRPRGPSNLVCFGPCCLEREKRTLRAKEVDTTMGFGAGFLKLTSSLSLLVSLALIGVSAYVYNVQDAHVGDIKLIKSTIIASIVLGSVIFIMSIVGYAGASTQSRTLLFMFFFVMQICFTRLPWIYNELERLCADHPWEHCADDIPKIESQIDQHIVLIRNITLGVSLFTMGVLHSAFLAASESKRAGYEEIPAYGRLQTYFIA